MTLEEVDALQQPRFQNWDPVLCLRAMKAKGATPILNVSDVAASPVNSFADANGALCVVCEVGLGEVVGLGDGICAGEIEGEG